MLLKNIRFREKNRDDFEKTVLKNANFKNIKSVLLSQNQQLIEAILIFFQRNKRNDESINNELERLQDDLQLIEITDGKDSDIYKLTSDLNRTLTLIYGYSREEFNKFRSNLVEYVSFIYFAISTPFVKNKISASRKFYHEPRIFYKGNKSLNHQISNLENNGVQYVGEGANVVDLVHINRCENALDLCESKADINYLLINIKLPNDQSQRSLKDQKKWRYMKSVKLFFDEKVEDCRCSLSFFTFADTINNADTVDGIAEIISAPKIIRAFCGNNISK